MAQKTASTYNDVINTVADFRWLRNHISIFLVGVSLLVMVDLLIGGSRRWSLVATALGCMLLFAHGVILAIARLSRQLLDDAPGASSRLHWPMPRHVSPESTWERPALPTEIEATWKAVPPKSEEEELAQWQEASDSIAETSPDPTSTWEQNNE